MFVVRKRKCQLVNWVDDLCLDKLGKDMSDKIKVKDIKFVQT